MNNRDLSDIIREQERTNVNGSDRMAASAFPTLMRKVYLWMTFALVITGLAAYFVAESDFKYVLYQSSALMWVLIIVELGLVFGISAMIHKLSLTTATLLFVLYSAINGVTLSAIFLAFDMAVIAKVFFITAGTFAAMGFIGYTTKKDLSGMGKILFMALIGIIIATVVNIFMKSEGLDMIISYIGVLIFVGLTAYDTQKIKNMLFEAEYADESYQKLALLGSLTLYLDFINLFIYLLRIFGSRD